MKEESKYYIPDIEELLYHLISEGFLYTPTGDKIIFRHDRKESMLNDFIMSNNYNTNDGYSINPELYSLKHLDQEDIESLGFKFIKKGWSEESKIFRSNKGVGHEIYFRGNGSVHITISTGHVIFEGTVKNKSELKRLLKQIGV